jgi:3-oxoacyl-[acyl-carrier protein] reductase
MNKFLRLKIEHALSSVHRRLRIPEPRTPPTPELPLRGPRVDLDGKVALVTGATGEMGRAIALKLGACGARVALHYNNNREQGETLKLRLVELGTSGCLVTGDVASLDAVQAMRAVIEQELGPVNIVINNAVAWNPKKLILEQSIEAFDRMYRYCTLQSVITAKVFVPGMAERRWGRIIGISSEVAMQALVNTGDYTSGKRGMDGVLRVLAREVGVHQITVNQVAPGWVITNKDRMAGTEQQDGYSASIPLKRRGSDDDVANAVAFLASDLAAYISGAYIPVCGGNVMPAI